MPPSEEILALANALNAVVWEGDAASLTFTYISPNVEPLLGYPAGRWMEPTFWVDHIHPEDRDEAARFCRTATAAGRDHVFDYRFQAADGRWLWLQEVVRVPPGGDVQSGVVHGVMYDISAQRRLHDALSFSESDIVRRDSRFRALIEHSTDLVSILDAGGTVRYASPSHESLLGWTPAELEGKSAFELVHPDDLAGLADIFGAGIGIPDFTATAEFRYRRKDGTWRALEGRARSLIHDPLIQGAVINARDVTERKEAEERLHYRLLVEQVLADVSNQLARASGDSFDASVHEALGIVGRALGTQRAVIALFSHGRTTWHVRHEWDAEGVPPVSTRLQSVPYESMPWLMATLESQGWADTADLPAESVGHAINRSLGIARGQGVSLTARGRALGFLVLFDGTDRGDETAQQRLEVLRLLSDVCANAIARRQEEETRSALLDLTRQLSGTLDLDEMFERVPPTITALLGCDAVSIHHADEETGRLRLVAVHGGDGDPRAIGDESEAQAGHPLYEILRSGRTVVTDTASQPWYEKERLERFGMGPFMLAPLLVRGELRGMAGAARRQGARPFDAAEVELFEGMARQISLALQGAEAYRTRQREANVASALVRVGRELISSLDQPVLLDRLSRLTTDILGCDTSITYLIDREKETCVPVAVHGEPPERREAILTLELPIDVMLPLIERLERDGIVHLVEGEPQDVFPPALARRPTWRAITYIALRRGDEVVGALSAGWRDEPHRLDGDEMRIAEGLGQLASLALVNTRVVAELARVSRLKSDFVATMSHELRTPINVIMGYNDLLLDDAFGPLVPEQSEVVERVRRSASELLELINATLDVSRLDSGQVPVDRQAVDLVPLLKQIEREIELQRTTRSVPVLWEEVDALPPLFSDAAKIKVIVKNLIGNALKFTDHGSITVTVSRRDDGVEIAVADTGIGIPRDEREAIFDAFRQVDGSSTRRHGGVGLGLYIVRRFLDLLGGRLTLESELGRGSTFRVWLPAAAARVQSAAHG